jgi:hypothetical protein
MRTKERREIERAQKISSIKRDRDRVYIEK